MDYTYVCLMDPAKIDASGLPTPTRVEVDRMVCTFEKELTEKEKLILDALLDGWGYVPA